MIDHVGEQLAGRGLGLHALEQLIARRAQELDLHERKALVERLDDRLLALGDVGRVEDELAFLLGGLDQLGRAELRLRASGSEREGECDEPPPSLPRSGDQRGNEAERMHHCRYP